MIISRQITLVLVLSMAVGGCTEWVQSGRSTLERDRDLADCKRMSYQSHPSQAVLVSNPGYWSTTQICDDDDDNGKSDKRKRKNKCSFRQDYTPSSDSIVDPSSSARDVWVEACMYRRGYEKK
jgi:hypothetical protein